MSKPLLKVIEKVRLLIFARAGGMCERCGAKDHPHGWSIHHRRPRMMGGSRNPNLHLPANLILLCGSGITGCHGWTESNRDQARIHGYLLYEIDDPERIPFVDSKGYFWWIDNSGQKSPFGTTNTTEVG